MLLQFPSFRRRRSCFGREQTGATQIENRLTNLLSTKSEDLAGRKRTTSDLSVVVDSAAIRFPVSSNKHPQGAHMTAGCSLGRNMSFFLLSFGSFASHAAGSASSPGQCELTMSDGPPYSFTDKSRHKPGNVFRMGRELHTPFVSTTFRPPLDSSYRVLHPR